MELGDGSDYDIDCVQVPGNGRAYASGIGAIGDTFNPTAPIPVFVFSTNIMGRHMQVLDLIQSYIHMYSKL